MTKKYMPTVGETCEVRGDNVHTQGKSPWARIKVTGVTDYHVIGYIRSDRESALDLRAHGHEFRPLPTPKEQWMQDALLLGMVSGSPKALVEAVHDAIADGTLPIPESTKEKEPTEWWPGDLVERLETPSRHFYTKRGLYKIASNLGDSLNIYNDKGGKVFHHLTYADAKKLFRWHSRP